MTKSRRLLLDPRQLSSVILRAPAILWAFRRTNRNVQFHKRSQQFIRAHNETLSVVAMCVCNPDRSPFGINR
jgi:hypothetical protein